jgi:hypothetical protein
MVGTVVIHFEDEDSTLDMPLTVEAATRFAALLCHAINGAHEKEDAHYAEARGN